MNMNLYNYFVSFFTISEIALLVLKRSKKSSVKIQSDGKSMLFLWLTISASLTIGYIIAMLHILVSGDPVIFEGTGILIFIAGFIVRWTAIIQLGKMFTVDVAISSSHVLKTDGIFRIVRHPSYLGLLLIILGLAVLMNNVLAFIIIIIPIFFAINYRIFIEEKALTAEFGEQYERYKIHVRKIIPLLY